MMIRANTKQILAIALSSLLVLQGAPVEAVAQQAAPSAYPGQGAPLSAADLQQLVAPIALYPDALVAQILGAATFPDQIVAAAGWLKNQYLTGAPLANLVNTQQWDPSVKALTQFPSVLNNLASNLSWTSALGEAYHTQPSDIMSAVQFLRAKAQAAGNLKSGSQITVVQQAPQVIVIQPTNPQVVYVPTYNPTVVYGTPYVTPGYSTAAVVTTAVLAFGVGIAVGAAMSNNSWGYSYWNCNWHGGTVVYHSSGYYGNSAWHGGYYGSSATAYGPNGVAKAGNAYNPSTGTYARGASTTTAYGTQKVGQAYNPNTGAYAATHQTSNAYGSYGSSVVSKNGNTAYTQHQTTAAGSVGSVQTSAGGKGVAASGTYGNNAAAGQTANGNKYATANGNVYKNTGSGWNQTQGTSHNTSSYSGANSAAAKGYGGQEKSSGSSAFGGGSSGWQSRQESARGSASRGGGGGWGGRR
ncbi:DUF3300 domain-containing protein [Tunturibacter psychrotolerans]|uniref:DUF3300 domain-containing protein n=1 Tax=Tunturiibacter psychrotolerans TaxID=3069686 RepID=A0AAU7ZRT8_9BACT